MNEKKIDTNKTNEQKKRKLFKAELYMTVGIIIVVNEFVASTYKSNWFEAGGFIGIVAGVIICIYGFVKYNKQKNERSDEDDGI